MKLLKFLPNRVWRVYRGGACLDQLRSVPEPADGSFPEEWIASTVAALNPQHGCPGEGISRVLLPDGSAERFDRMLEREAETLLGPDHPASAGRTPGFLTKLLDSAIRLARSGPPRPGGFAAALLFPLRQDRGVDRAGGAPHQR